MGSADEDLSRAQSHVRFDYKQYSENPDPRAVTNRGLGVGGIRAPANATNTANHSAAPLNDKTWQNLGHARGS